MNASNNSVQPYPATIPATFDEEAKKYQCCCGCMHSRLATLIFISLELLLYILAAICFLIAGPSGVILLSSLIFYVIYILFIILSYVGICRNTACLLVPYAVLQALCVLGGTIGIIYVTVELVSILASPQYDESYRHEYYTISTTVVGVTLGGLLFYLAFKIWILVVVSKCFNYLWAKRKYLSIYSQQPISTVPLTMPNQPLSSSVVVNMQNTNMPQATPVVGNARFGYSPLNEEAMSQVGPPAYEKS